MSRPREYAHDFNSLRRKLLNKGALFVDQQFPATDKSLFSSIGAEPSIFHLQRPKEITASPQFIVDGVNRHDISQGVIGNCWFVAGAAMLASTRRDLFERVVPLDQGFEPDRYTGMFRFNFWWYGKWVEVVIDDYLPTNGQGVIYARNRENPNEFWPCLLEKAYAKLYGSYRTLVGGVLNDALVDMTGGISETIGIQDKRKIRPDIYSLVVKSYKMNSLMGANIDTPNTFTGVSNNLNEQHTYCITGFYQINTDRVTAKLVRLRNPWGHKEWNGAWADRSDEMRKLANHFKDELKFIHTDDGEFWMSFDDFTKNFDTILLCHTEIDSFSSELANNDVKQTWHMLPFHKAWIKGHTAGGCGNPPHQDLFWKNPQMTINLWSPDTTAGHGDGCTLIVSLMIKDKQNKPDIKIGFRIFMPKSHGLEEIGNSSLSDDPLVTHTDLREITKRFVLKPGKYVIIASTLIPNEEAEFLLRTFTEHPAAERQTNFPNSAELPPFVPSVNDLVSRTFERHAGPDLRLDANELCAFLENVATSELGDTLKLSIESCRSVITVYNKQKSGFLNLDETKQAWKQIKGYMAVFKQFDVNRSNSVDIQELGTLFLKLGLQVNQNLFSSIVGRFGGRDNQISLPDFILVICRLTFLFSTFQEQHKTRPGSGDTAEFTLNEFLESTLLI